jgi:NAD(P)H-dependent flavin oxidoreductase YrpB (nitropropane dioxygenase family)
MLTADAQRRIAKYQVEPLAGMPVGQIVGRMTRVRPVKDVIYDMVSEFVDVTEHLNRLVSEAAPTT